MLYAFLCNPWKRNVLVMCILNDAHVMIPPPHQWLTEFKDYVFIKILA